MHLLRSLARGGVAPVARRTIPIARPDANTGFALAPETGRAWEVLSLSTSFVTASDVANRAVTLSLFDGQSTLWSIPPTAVQAASLTVTYSWIAGYTNAQTATVGGQQAVGMPPTILVPGWSLVVTVAAIAATDRFAVPNAQVIEAFTGQTEAEYNTARAIAHHAEALYELLEVGVPGI